MDACLRAPCGANAYCKARNHSPTCICLEGFEGDPFTSCRQRQRPRPEVKIDPCSPSPCGSNAICRVVGVSASCACIEGFIGRPPNCRPECIVNEDCPQDRSCVGQKCVDPCNCGVNADCRVIRHNAQCECRYGFTGTPQTYCYPIERTTPAPIVTPVSQPCNPSPCKIF